MTRPDRGTGPAFRTRVAAGSGLPWPCLGLRHPYERNGMRIMSYSPLAKLAGPSALASAVLILAAQAMMLPFDPKDHVATSQEPLFRTGGVIYMIGFCVLLIALVGACEWLTRSAGVFATVAGVTALVGTMPLGGDAWFEAFAVPWLADRAPAALDTEPTVLMGLGAITSYGAFAAGWAMFGFAGLRAHAFPAPICLTIIIGAILGFRALLSPWAVPFALGVGALGIWMLRTTPGAPTAPDRPAAAPAT